MSRRHCARHPRRSQDMSLLPLTGQPVSLTLILVELAQPERKRYTKAHSCRCDGVAYADRSSVAGAITDAGRRGSVRLVVATLHIRHCTLSIAARLIRNAASS